MSELAVRATRADETAAVHALLAAAGAALAAEGFRNWEVPLPLARIEEARAAGELFTGLAGGALVATYMLRRAPAHVYAPAPWDEPAAPARYLNRMAIHPRCQGRGLGARLLAHVDRHARDEGARVVRCDVLAANTRLRAFYERHGYRACGGRRHSGWDFACYERRLD